MMILVKGRPDSGKSGLAEHMAMNLAAPEEAGRRRADTKQGRLLYLATMIPYGEEGEARVRKHRAMREGKGFETLEIPSGFRREEPELASFFGGICLLECVANLAGNEMHAPEHAEKSRDEIRDTVVEEILWLRDRMKHLVVVTDMFTETMDADEETREYIRLVDEVNQVLEQRADRVEGTL